MSDTALEPFKYRGKTLMPCRRFYAVFGQSWKGRTTKRNGKTVECGHKHKRREAAEKCAKRMRLSRPGKCQDYQVASLVMVIHQ